MDPTYQQAMIQALMGQGSLPTSMTGQNPTSPYGQSFMTGGLMMPAGGAMGNQSAMNAAQGSSAGGYSPYSTSNSTMPSTSMSQPMSTYSY